MWGPIIAAGIQAGGSLLGGMMGASGQQSTNAQQMAFASQEAATNRNWQEHMSNTAYQRQMADMRAAGLNPILAANMGGASSPGGAQGSANLGNPGAFSGAGVASASGMAGKAMELKAIQEQTEKAKSETTLNEQTEKNKKAEEALTHELNKKAKQDTATSAAQQHGITTTAANTQADTINKGIQSIILSHDANTAFQKSRAAKAEADQSEKYGPGPAGAIGGTSEKVIGRLLDTFRNPLEGQKLSSPTDPRFWGLRGRPDPKGEGLVIDMRK